MPSPRRRSPDSVPRRRLFIHILIIFGLLGAVAVVLDRLADAGQGTDPDAGATVPPPSPPAAGGPPVAAVLPERPIESALGEAPPVLALSGEFPEEGPGTFRFAGGEGDVLGESGPVRRFRVAVEDGVDEDPAEFAGFVEDTLGDQRSWIASGLRFQRVAGRGGYDFTIYLATTGTTARLCAADGLDVVGGELPEGGVSCRMAGRVVLNLTRWRQSVPGYVDTEVPLEVYRQMLARGVPGGRGAGTGDAAAEHRSRWLRRLPVAIPGRSPLCRRPGAVSHAATPRVPSNNGWVRITASTGASS
jgi:Protein of unknown function (DUF3152)